MRADIASAPGRPPGFLPTAPLRDDMPDLLPNGDAQPPSPRAPPASPPAAPSAFTVSRRPFAVNWALSTWSATTLGPGGRPSAPSMDSLMDAAMHGVRNSLSAIRLGVDLLARRGDLNEPDAVLEHLDSAAVRAHEQAEELADFCRLAAGRTIAMAAKRFPLHHVIGEAIEARRSSHEAIAIEHDRLGHGDCLGDPARLAQFVRLALEELAPRAASRCIVVSEIDGARFRIAVHAGDAPTRDATETPGQQLARAHRQALLRAIADAHRGELRLVAGTSIEGRFAGAG